MKLILFFLLLFSFLSVAQDKGIPPFVKITPTPTPTATPIVTSTPHYTQEILNKRGKQETKYDKKKAKEEIKKFGEQLKKLNSAMATRSATCSNSHLVVNLDPNDYMTSYHRLKLLFDQIDPDLPPPPASCQVCVDANQAIKDYFTCLLKDDEKNQEMIGTDFKAATNDPIFYSYMEVKIGVEGEPLKSMKNYCQYLNGLIK